MMYLLRVESCGLNVDDECSGHDRAASDHDRTGAGGDAGPEHWSSRRWIRRYAQQWPERNGEQRPECQPAAGREVPRTSDWGWARR